MISLRPIITEKMYVHTGETSTAKFFKPFKYRGDKREKWRTVPIYEKGSALNYIHVR